VKDQSPISWRTLLPSDDAFDIRGRPLDAEASPTRRADRPAPPVERPPDPDGPAQQQRLPGMGCSRG
jgi:hypothetical protein